MAEKKQYNFGVGRIFVKPAKVLDGPEPNPIPIGVVQEASLEITTTQVELHGEYQFPVDVARGKGSVKGKLKYGALNAGLVNSIMSGSTKTTGTTAIIADPSTAIPATPYQLTAVEGATFVEDLGVYDDTADIAMTRVASSATLAAGQYKVDEATGEYTFAAADTTHKVTIVYSYTLPTGSTVAVVNPLMGAGSNYQLILGNSYKGLTVGVKLYNVIIEKLAMAFKNDSHTLTDADFTASADADGNIIDFYGGV